MITRRQWVLGTVGAAASATGVALLVSRLSRHNLQHVGPYAALLAEVVDDEGIRVDVERIGREYLKQSGAQRNAGLLLRELAPIDIDRPPGDNADSITRQLREAVQTKIHSDFQQGVLLRVDGYFIPESLAKFCAASVLAVQEAA